MIVTFDFDNTISMSNTTLDETGEVKFVFEGYNWPMVDIIKRHIANNDEVFIVTARDQSKEGFFPRDNVPFHLKRLKLDGYFLNSGQTRLFYTDGELKVEKLLELGSQTHWDDSPEEMKALKTTLNRLGEQAIPWKSPLSLKNLGIDSKRPKNDHEKEAVSRFEDTSVVAKVLVFDQNDKLLLLKRSDEGKAWDIPGGHLKGFEVNRDEKGVELGLEREVMEETGILLPFEKFLGRYDFVWKAKPHNISVFATKLDASEPKPNLFLQSPQENTDFVWVSRQELEEFLPKSTQVVKNAVKMLPKGQLFEQNEPFQRKVKKNHFNNKKKLIGYGDNKHFGGGKGHKIASARRSNSAPPGVLEEDDKEKKQVKVKILKNSLKAAIVMGNPAHLAKNKQISRSFYNKIAEILKKQGFSVDFFESKANTWPGKPKKMLYDLWIGHSLGADRLEGAVEGGYTTKVIAFGVPDPEKQPFLALNHPDDDPKPGKTSGKEHYLLSNEMKSALNQLISDLKVEKLDEKRKKKRKKPRKKASRGPKKTQKPRKSAYYGGYIPYDFGDSGGGGDGGGAE